MTPKEKAKELYDFNWNWLYTSADYSKTVLANCCKVLAANTCNEVMNSHGEAGTKGIRSYWNEVKNEIISYTPFP